MSLLNTHLEETLEEWYSVRKGFIAEVKNIPPARFSFRPTLESRSALEMVQHVLENAITASEELLREDANMQRAPFNQLVTSYSASIALADNKEKLIDLLVEQYRDSDQRIRKKGELFMLQTVSLFDGKKRTRISILEQVINHEMYHRGQMALSARLLGIEPALTRELRLGPHSPIHRSPEKGLPG
jgi:uncharacterized damage-inducible protein DinB